MFLNMFCNTMPAATLLFAVCFMATFVSGVEEVNEGCTWKDPETGKLYDISSLRRTVVGDEYVFNDDKGGKFIYKAN